MVGLSFAAERNKGVIDALVIPSVLRIFIPFCRLKSFFRLFFGVLYKAKWVVICPLSQGKPLVSKL